MDKNEKNVMDRIRKATDDVEVPDRLKPERMQEVLEGKKPKKRLQIYRIGLLAAACLAVVSGILLWTSSKEDLAVGINRSQNGGKEKISDDKQIASAESYEQIYDYIKEYQDRMEIQERSSTTYDIGSMEMESSEDSAATSGSYSGDYSQTNVRQEGVDEGDIVKTDGRYLYVVEDNGQTVDIVKADGGNLEKSGSIELGKDYDIREIYLNTEKQKLVIVCERVVLYNDSFEAQTDSVEDDYVWDEQKTVAITYDIQDVSHPSEEGRVSQSGSYSSSRMAGGYLYLFSEYYVGGEIDKVEPRTYIPLINEKTIEESSICLPQIAQGCMYEVITSINIENPDQVEDNKAIFSKGGQVYVSNHNIYFYETEWSDFDSSVTTIRKISYQNGQLEAKKQGSFKGYLNDSFSIDEYDGYLRVVTTFGDTNAVYVLDENLKVTGSIEDLAEDERIYSARFFGDTGYFVTFRETDPLFSVDLSDPENPKILGELKIPGFSEYLHFYGGDRLLGIGMSADEETGSAENVKLSMFDISDNTDVKEVAMYELEDVFGTDVSYDYKSVLADPEKNLIGFAGYTWSGENYYLFTYDEKDGFICKLEEEINGNTSRGTRGIYIQDTLYVIQGNVIEAYRLSDSEKVGDFIL